MLKMIVHNNIIVETRIFLFYDYMYKVQKNSIYLKYKYFVTYFFLMNKSINLFREKKKLTYPNVLNSRVTFSLVTFFNQKNPECIIEEIPTKKEIKDNYWVNLQSQEDKKKSMNSGGLHRWY